MPNGPPSPGIPQQALLRRPRANLAPLRGRPSQLVFAIITSGKPRHYLIMTHCCQKGGGIMYIGLIYGLISAWTTGFK